MNDAPQIPVIDPDPSTEPRDGVHVCLGCAARRLAEPHCVACARLASFCHLALAVDRYERAQVDERDMRRNLIANVAFNLGVLAIVLAMAAAGVKAAIAYAGFICVLVAITFLSIPVLRRRARAASDRQRDHVLDMLGLRVTDFPELPAGKMFTIRHEVLLEHVRKKFPAVSIAAPVRGTDFDVPPLPPRPE